LMIRLVIGKLDYGGVSGAPAITFKEYNGSVRLNGVPDMELKPLTKLVINKILNVLGIQFDTSNIKRLSDAFEYCTQCSWFSGYINFVGEALPENAIATVPIPMIEPISTIIGLALAFNNPNFEAELYSDLWPQITDVLAQARALGLKLTIHTSVLDYNRLYPFDEVVRRYIRLPRIDVLANTTNFDNRVEVAGENYRTPTLEEIRTPKPTSLRAEPSVIEPRIDEEVLNAVRALGTELGGVATLKALSDLVGSEAVIRAVVMGYLTYNPTDLSVRLSTKGLALLGATTEEGTEEEKQGSEEET